MNELTSFGEDIDCDNNLQSESETDSIIMKL